MKRRHLIALMTALLMTMAVNAQDVFDLNKIREARPIIDVVEEAPFTVYPLDIFNDWAGGDILFVDGASISPDARHLAFSGQFRSITNLVTDYLCTYSFEADESRCYIVPETLASFGSLVWSPDSRYVAFTEENIRGGDETDIWLYSMERHLLLNLTQDNVNGNLIEPEALIDILPTWNPFDGSLMFFRNATPNGVSPTYEVYRITQDEMNARFDEFQTAIDAAIQANIQGAEESGIDQPVNTFTVQMEEQMTLSPANLELVTTIDHIGSGSDIAVSFREAGFGPTQIDAGGLFMAYAVNNPNDITQAGIWLLDLNAGSSIPLLTGENVRSEEPDWIRNFTFTDIQWTFDSTGLLIIASNEGDTAIYKSAYYFNIASGTLNSILDYGQLADEGEFFSGDVPFYVPDSAVLLPDDTFFYFNRSTRDMLRAAAVPPPPTGSLPEQITLPENLVTEARTASSMGFNEEVIRVVFDINIITLSR